MKGALAALTTVCALACFAAPAAGAVHGSVFMDYNANGRRDAGGFIAGTSAAATDGGVADVTVSAFDANGVRVATTTTAADGTYTLATSGSATVRIDFGTPSGYASSFVGVDNASSVRFVAGDTAAAVDYAITSGGEYCQDNPKLVTCLMPYLANYPVNAPGALMLDSKLGALTIGQRGESLGGTPGNGTTVTSPTAMGTTWGVGTDRGGNAYYGAYVKRHSPYGPGSTGTNGNANWIYKVDLATGTTTPWIRLGINTLPAHVAAAPTGWPSYSADGYRSDNNASDVFHLVGRSGIGDVDVSPDGSTLYAVEMTQADPKLWSVPIVGAGANAQAGAASAVSIPAPSSVGGVTCDGVWHPMGLGWSAGSVLVGGVCAVEKPSQSLAITSTQSVAGGSEPSPGPGTSNLAITFAGPHGLHADDLVSMTAFQRADGKCTLTDGTTLYSPATNFFEIQSVTNANTIVIDTGEWGVAAAGALRCAGLAPASTTGTVALYAGRQLSAFVLRYDSATQSFTSLAAVDLSYNKAVSAERFDISALYKFDDYGLSFYWSGLYKKLAVWRTWNDWDPLPGELSLNAAAQPMLANIEVRPDGNLVLGFRDRWLDQTAASGPIDYDSTAGSPQVSQSYNASADILVLCKSGSGYEMERNGACGAATGASMPRMLDGEIDPTVRPNSPLYYWNGYVDSLSTGIAVRHAYTGQGGIAMMPGGPLWTTAYDITSINQQGVRALGACPTRTGNGSCGPAGVADGAILGGTRFSASISTSACGANCWGKGNGLGDLELVCDAAPVQIGNRVWIDANRDGIQDASEEPVAGVTVRLYDATGALVGTAITDAGGTYTFSSNVTKPAAGDGSNVGGGLLAGAEFTVKLDNPADYAAGGPLSPYSLTTANVVTQGTSVNSKATTVDGYPTIRIPARQAGDNNHTFDVGFAAPATASASTPSSSTTPASELVAVGDYTWVDANRDGVQNEQPLAGVKVTLLTTTGKRAKDADGKSVKTKATNAQGYYVFDGLRAGKYKVQFRIPTGTTFTITSTQKDAHDSNPIPTKANPLIGVTPVFEVYAAVKGNTIRNTNKKLNASYIDPTIDAGVVFCAHTKLAPQTVQVGRTNRVVATVTLAGKPFANRTVVLSGNGPRMTAKTNAKGVVVFTLAPTAAGSYTVRVIGESSTCQPELLGAATTQSLTG